MNSHSESVKGVLATLGTNEHGLANAEARRRLGAYGPNVLRQAPRRTWLLFIGQFNSPVIWLLIGALIISVLFGERIDASIILAIVILNAALGFFQEHKAQRAIAALKALLTLKTTVMRNGEESIIDAAELVPGDIVILEMGMHVPADCRVLQSSALLTQEAALTGESLPVRKTTLPLPQSTGVADRTNSVFAGTIVAGGRGVAVVTATGMNTEIGKIAHMLQARPDEPTLLQDKLNRIGVWVTVAVVIIATIVFIAGLAQGQPLLPLFMLAVALAVAAVPESLPAVVTLTLAIGVQRMARRNALMRKLSAVQTLGSCTIIFTDKTGTLTRNEMTVREIYVPHERILIGPGMDKQGRHAEACRMLLTAGAQCNNATLSHDSGTPLGDPTEIALLVSASKLGVGRETLAHEPRLAEIPFSSERKRMTTIHRLRQGRIAYTKGGLDDVLRICTRKQTDGRVSSLTAEDRQRIRAAAESMSKRSLRVLAFAYRPLRTADKSDPSIERELTFVGLQGMMDPPRPEAREAVATARKAGIRVVMITGDHPLTAAAIAKEIGIPGRVMTGDEVDASADIYAASKDVGVFARVDPAHKLRIVEAYRAKGQVVAMTGDGVNDAPALKAADIGVAMGRIGTDVAREASTMVLADDNFATIVEAVRGGRAILDNITKFVSYMLSTNTAELLTVFICMLLFYQFPVTLIMLLWLNLVTDGLPALALAAEKADPQIMRRRPLPVDTPLISGRGLFRLLTIGALLTVFAIALFAWRLPYGLPYAQTFTFTSLVLMEMAVALSERSDRSTIAQLGLFSNPWVLGSVALTVFLQALVVHCGSLQRIFGTVALSAADWRIAIGAAVIVFLFAQAIVALLGRQGKQSLTPTLE